MSAVEFKNVSKVYDGKVEAVKDLSLAVEDGEFVVLAGPSGCGKSTTLRLLAGLEEVTDGEIYIDSKRVDTLPPGKRNVTMVFQNYALFPHMTVFDNIAFPLRRRHMAGSAIKEKVHETAELLGITELLKRKPKELSGGQKQRVAIGRSLVRDASAFLMDEPLSNLDAALRSQLRIELLRLRERIHATFLYVTHDQTEAMTLGDRIVVMRDGVVQQSGTPLEIYNNPENLFTAGFIGTPSMNFLDAELFVSGEQFAVDINGFRIPLTQERNTLLKSRGMSADPRPVTVGVRPEHIKLSNSGIPAEVTFVEQLGSLEYIHAVTGDMEIMAVTAPVNPGKDVRLSIDPEKIHIFDAGTGNSIFQ